MGVRKDNVHYSVICRGTPGGTNQWHQISYNITYLVATALQYSNGTTVFQQRNSYNVHAGKAVIM